MTNDWIARLSGNKVCHDAEFKVTYVYESARRAFCDVVCYESVAGFEYADCAVSAEWVSHFGDVYWK